MVGPRLRTGGPGRDRLARDACTAAGAADRGTTLLARSHYAPSRVPRRLGAPVGDRPADSQSRPWLGCGSAAPAPSSRQRRSVALSTTSSLFPSKAIATASRVATLAVWWTRQTCHRGGGGRERYPADDHPDRRQNRIAASTARWVFRCGAVSEAAHCLSRVPRPRGPGKYSSPARVRGRRQKFELLERKYGPDVAPADMLCAGCLPDGCTEFGDEFRRVPKSTPSKGLNRGPSSGWSD
ncbi:hypothetical protein MLGJGCBP_04018 [Rhodococcus sp. T7]|nr:hypothetical protein MLGJGCBP_04018 [Rhodococcus sp. T7]